MNASSSHSQTARQNCLEDHETRESTLRQYELVGSEELERNSDEFQFNQQKPKMTPKPASIEGAFICRDHVEPRVQLNVPKQESVPIPMKLLDTTFGMLMEIELCQIHGQDSRSSHC